MSKTTKKTQPRVWIELEKPESIEHGKQLAEMATRMLRRLGIAESSIRYGENHKGVACYRYQHDIAGTYSELADRGQWFNLEYLGREVEDKEEDAQHFAALQAKMVDCGWGDDPDGKVRHERLGLEQPSWVDAISACIEVASEV